MTNWPVQKQKQTQRTTQNHVEYQDATDIQKKILFVFLSLIYYKYVFTWNGYDFIKIIVCST